MIGLLLPLRLLDVVPVGAEGPPGCAHELMIVARASLALDATDPAQSMTVARTMQSVAASESAAVLVMTGSARLTVEEC